MSKVRLRFSPNILRRLGEELNPNPDQGILELVKNSYDADATKCVVELDGTNAAGGTITVTDNGVGLNRDTIVRGWLLLGSSTKSIQEPTRKGRQPAGNKGLGRLAALRMGSTATLKSRPRSEPGTAYSLAINWNDYDTAEAIEDVVLSLRRFRRPRPLRPGTTITIENVRSRISRMDVKRLARGLLLLADPFADSPTGFRPVLKALEFHDLEKLVERRYFDDAEFHLIAKVDKSGIASASVVDWKGETLYEGDHAAIRPKTKVPYSCPAATFDLWAYILSKETFSSRTTTLAEVREWLTEFGGVHLYIRGLRVAPYGNPGNDWLDMNLSRARSPEVRPSTNTAIGRITAADLDEHFLQKTDRAGLIEGDAFHELRRFAIDALDWMARRRMEERDRRRAMERIEAPTKSQVTKENVEAAIKELPPARQKAVQDSFAKYDRAREREMISLRKEVQLYRTLSTTGITAALFAHESKQPLNLIHRNAKQVERLGQTALPRTYAETLAPAVERILRQTEALRAFGSLTLSQIANEKRRSGKVDVYKVINEVLSTFRLFVADRRVTVTCEFYPSQPYLRGSEAALESIITNLLANSLRAFEQSTTRDRTILIRTTIVDQLLSLQMLDSGPGIIDLNVKDIWLPGETTYHNGTGLGLTIVRDTVKDLGGNIEAIASGALGGATFIIELPTLGAE